MARIVSGAFSSPAWSRLDPLISGRTSMQIASWASAASHIATVRSSKICAPPVVAKSSGKPSLISGTDSHGLAALTRRIAVG